MNNRRSVPSQHSQINDKNFSRIPPNVKIASPTFIEEFTILGHPLLDGSTPELIIGKNALIRSHSVIYAGNVIGESFSTGHGVLIRENNRIGDQVSIGSHTIVERNSIIDDFVRIHSSAFIPEFTHLHHHVWLGPHVVCINDPHPPCAKCMKGPEIMPYAKIGGNVTLLDHVTIGENSIVGAGSVVINDVPPNSIVVGNPAKIVKKIKSLKCSEKNGDDLLKSYLGAYFSESIN